MLFVFLFGWEIVLNYYLHNKVWGFFNIQGITAFSWF